MTVTGFTELFPRATRWAKHSCDPHHGSVPQGSGTWARRALGCPQSRTAHLGLRPGSAPNPSFLLVCVLGGGRQEYLGSCHCVAELN